MESIDVLSSQLISAGSVEVMAVAAGSSGTVYLTGYFTQSLNGLSAAGGRDAFIAKIDQGTVSWLEPLGSLGDDHATSIALDSSGNVHIAGTTSGGLSGETNSGAEDAFVAKYSPSGTKLWLNLLGGSAQDQAFSVSIGTDNSVFIAGTTWGGVGGAPFFGGVDSFVAKYDSSGVRQSIEMIGTASGYDTLFSTVVDNSGSVYLAGSSKGGTLFGHPGFGGADVYIAKYDSFLNQSWIRFLGSAGYDRGYAIKVAPDGSVYVAGFASGTVNGQASYGGSDCLLTKYDSNGNPLWTRIVGTPGTDYAFALDINAQGEVYVAGTTNGSLDGRSNLGGFDAFVTKFDSSGTKLWTNASGTSSNDVINSIAIGDAGEIYITGSTSPLADAANLLRVGYQLPTNSTKTALRFGPPTISVSSSKSFLSTGETALLSFTLSEPSTDFAESDITVNGGNLSSFSGSGTSYTAIFTPHPRSTTDGVISIASGSFSDAFGNFNTDGAESNNTVTIEVDTVHPRISISSNKGTLKAGEVASLTFTLNEPSTDFTVSDVSFTGGALSSFSGSGTTYTVTFTPTSQSTTSAVVSVASGVFSNTDSHLNIDGADADNTVTMSVDTIRPTVAVSANRTTLKTGETALISFTLSESSTDFTAADVSVSGGTLSSFSGAGTSYTAVFTLQSAESSGVVSVASNKFSDAAGNFNTDGAEADNSVTFAAAKLWGTSRNDYGKALATGPDGTIYLAGETEGNLGGQSGSGMRDIFLSKMNADGTAVWTKLAGTRLVEEATHLAVASDGSVYMSGTSQASLNGAGNSGSYDAYLLKYDANGNMLWTVRQGTSTIDRGYSVATDSTGAAYLVGQTDGRLDGQRGNGNFDGFITKYSAEGSKLWTRVVGTAGIDAIKDVVTDASGFVYVTGSVSGTLAGQTRIGGTDAFITKYGSDGTVVWTKVFGTKTTDYAESIGLGSDGSIYVAGQTLGSMNGASSGNYDVFLTKFSSAGVQQWSRQFGSGKADNALDLVVGSSGVITITGHLGLSGTSGLGLADAFTASFNASGTQTAYEVFGTGSNDYGTAVTEGLDGVLYMAGYTLGSAMIGRPSNGAADAYFFARANQTTLTSANVTAAASASPDVFTFAAGSYNATITGGFAYGDKLVFPASMTNLSVSNTSPTDGQILITASGSGQQIQVTLTGVALGLDGAVTTLDSFWATFGPPGT